MNRFAGVREKKEELDRKYQPADDLYLDETLPYTEYPTLVAKDCLCWDGVITTGSELDRCPSCDKGKK